MDNYSDRKRLGQITSNFDVSTKIVYIVHGWWPFSFARRTIVLLLHANDKSAWRVMFGSLWHVRSANFAWAKRFCYFEHPKSTVDVSFQQISWFFKCTNPMVRTLTPLQLLPQPMDRAEVLHTPSHTYKDRWKIVPIKNDWVESREISTFPQK